MASRAWIWVSVESKRTLTDWPSNCTAAGVMFCAANAASTRVTVAASTRTVALPAETCTAGASPKKLGRV